MTISATSFRGCNRFFPLLMFVPWKRLVDPGDLGYGPIKSPYNKLGTAIQMPSGVQRPRPSQAPELASRKAPELTSWKDWTNSSDWSPDVRWNSWTSWHSWNSWSSKEKWIQDERYEYQEQGNYEMESDLVSGKEAKDHGVGQWTNWPQKWEDWTWPEASCNEDDKYEEIVVDEENEALIKRSEEILQRHRAGKRGRSPSMKRSGKASSKPAKAGCEELDDDKRTLTRVAVQNLRYSQLSCKPIFQCGRSVSQLVQDLVDRKVSLSEPFLRLTVFQTTDRRSKKVILRCIDNRRLHALKKYAERTRKDPLMVNINLFSNDTLKQVKRFIRNSDNTDGRDVRIRNKWR